MRPKQHLEYYSKFYSSAWKQVDRFRAARGKDLPFWPEWCFMPLAGAYAIVSAEAESQGIDITSQEHRPLINDVGIIGALAAWRVTQGVYRFDSDVYRAVIDTPTAGDLPHNVLFNLPEWCVYIETPGLQVYGTPTVGFFAHLEHDANTNRKELRLVVDFDMPDSKAPPLHPVALHLGTWTLRESIDRAMAETQKQSSKLGVEFNLEPGLSEQLQAEYSALVSLLLYICAVNGEIGVGNRRPFNPGPTKTKKGVRMFPAPKVTVWDVGVRMGAALRMAAEAVSEADGTEGQRSGPRPHVRRAHWHGYWLGPRDGDRMFALKWLSPILVGGSADDMPVTIRPVE